MGYPTKVQLLKRQASEQWYVNFPAALAQAMEFEKGETVEWLVKNRYAVTLRRKEAHDNESRKKRSKIGRHLDSRRLKTRPRRQKTDQATHHKNGTG